MKIYMENSFRKGEKKYTPNLYIFKLPNYAKTKGAIRADT